MLSNIWKLIGSTKVIMSNIFYRLEDILRILSNWFLIMSEMIWVKILLGKSEINWIYYKIIIIIIVICRLNQSLQWPFHEVYGTAIFDFEPQGNNQLQLRAGCLVLIIGKDGDDRGWWRGKVGDIVSKRNLVLIQC